METGKRNILNKWISQGKCTEAYIEDRAKTFTDELDVKCEKK